VLNKFIEFRALVENHIRRKIKVFHLDNGGEYTSTKFDSLCREVGIKRELTVPYNAQHVDECSYVRHPPAYKPMRCGSLQLCKSFSQLTKLRESR